MGVGRILKIIGRNRNVSPRGFEDFISYRMHIFINICNWREASQVVVIMK
jgi:hypothetical protein